MTDIAFRSSNSVNSDTSSSTYTVTKPAGTTSGDVLIAIVGTISTTTFTAPGGWTSIEIDTTDTNVRLAAWYLVAGGSEPSSYAWTLGTAAKGFGWIGAYQNVDTGTPVDADTDGNVSSVNNAVASVTVVTAGAWVITAAIGRHTQTTARSFSTSDGSDSNRYTHGGASGSGFDHVSAVYDSNRTLSAVSASRTLTTNTGTENAIVWVAIALKPASPAVLKGRVVQAGLIAPQALPPLRARVVQAALVAPAPSGGKTARVVQAALVAPLPAGSPGKSGISVASGGNIRRVAVYSAKNGQVV